MDCFGNVKKRLRNRNLIYVTKTLDSKTKTEQNAFKIQFDEFKQTLKQKQKEKQSNTGNKKYSNKELEQYPQRFRFLSLLDRRKPIDDEKTNENKDIKEMDELIFFEPRADCYKFPKN
eukprot:430156_1